MVDIAASLEAVSRQYAHGCVKTQEDLDRYELAIQIARPALIIECGTFSGKSALWFARTARCPVITIDTDPHIDPDTEAAWADHDITLIVGPSTSSTVVDQVLIATQRIDGPIMVTLDSDHSAAHVLDEIRVYGPLVTPGSYLVVEDGLLRYMPEEERRHYAGNPLDAIEATLETTDDWELDTDLENLHPVTQFPSGWLVRR